MASSPADWKPAGGSAVAGREGAERCCEGTLKGGMEWAYGGIAMELPSPHGIWCYLTLFDRAFDRASWDFMT